MKVSISFIKSTMLVCLRGSSKRGWSTSHCVRSIAQSPLGVRDHPTCFTYVNASMVSDDKRDPILTGMTTCSISSPSSMMNSTSLNSVTLDGVRRERCVIDIMSERRSASSAEMIMVIFLPSRSPLSLRVLGSLPRWT